MKRINFNEEIEQVDYEPAEYQFTSNDVQGRYSKFKHHVSIWAPNSSQVNDHGNIGVVYTDFGEPWNASRFEGEELPYIQQRTNPEKGFISITQFELGDSIPLLRPGGSATFSSIEIIEDSYWPVERFRIHGLYKLNRWITVPVSWYEDGKCTDSGFSDIDITSFQLVPVWLSEAPIPEDFGKPSTVIDLNRAVILSDGTEVRRVVYRKSTDRISALVQGQYGWTSAFFDIEGNWVDGIDPTIANRKLINV